MPKCVHNCFKITRGRDFSGGPRRAYRVELCYFRFTTPKVSKTQAICSPGTSRRYPPGGYFGATIIHQEGYASREGGDSAIGWMPALLLCPKCGSQSIGLVPKRTIPLGGMVAQGPFPQEEWFPRFNFGAILCECIMVKQSLWQYALGLKQSLRHELEWRKGGGLQPRLRTFAI